MRDRYDRFPAPTPGQYASCRARYPGAGAMPTALKSGDSVPLALQGAGKTPDAGHAGPALRQTRTTCRAHTGGSFQADDNALRMFPLLLRPKIYLPDE